MPVDGCIVNALHAWHTCSCLHQTRWEQQMPRISCSVLQGMVLSSVRDYYFFVVFSYFSRVSNRSFPCCFVSWQASLVLLQPDPKASHAEVCISLDGVSHKVQLGKRLVLTYTSVCLVVYHVSLMRNGSYYQALDVFGSCFFAFANALFVAICICSYSYNTTIDSLPRERFGGVTNAALHAFRCDLSAMLWATIKCRYCSIQLSCCCP